MLRFSVSVSRRLAPSLHRHTKQTETRAQSPVKLRASLARPREKKKKKQQMFALHERVLWGHTLIGFKRSRKKKATTLNCSFADDIWCQTISSEVSRVNTSLGELKLSLWVFLSGPQTSTSLSYTLRSTVTKQRPHCCATNVILNSSPGLHPGLCTRPSIFYIFILTIFVLSDFVLTTNNQKEKWLL